MFDTHGISIRYRVAGRGPVLLVEAPGWGVGASIYEATFGPLEKDLTVVYWDPRGSGASGVPTDAADLHVGAFVDDLEALRAHLGLERFALMGHSHGGFIALHYALRHPDRVSRLMLLDAQLVGVEAHPDEPQRVPDADTNPDLEGVFRFLDSVGGFDELFRMKTDAEATAFMQRIVPMYFRDVSKSGALARLFASGALPVRTMQAVSGTDGSFPLGVGLRQFRVPTLIVAGRYDLVCPIGAARRLAETIPEARLALFEQSGHFPWIEEPEKFFALAHDFLSQGALQAQRGASR